MNYLRPGRASALEPIITADIDGRVVFLSRGADRVFGYTQSEAVGQPLTMLMPEKYRQAHEAGMERVRRERASRLQGQTLRLELLRKTADQPHFCHVFKMVTGTTPGLFHRMFEIHKNR